MSLWRVLLAAVAAAALVLAPAGVSAAEVLQVRSATLLQVGDHNRSYSVELACVAVSAAQQQPALDWLRQELPRRTRVNLRPFGSRDGLLLASVQRLESADAASLDLASGLVDAGLASALPHCAG